MFSRGPNDPINGAPSVSSGPAQWISPEEYLEAERRAETRSEYFAGQVFALAGASREHNVVVTNLVIDLGTQLKGRPCELYASDMRLRIPATGLYTYPDVTVVCGVPQFEDHHTDTLLNPTVLIEVLSDSTERHDRGRKAEDYRRIVSLVEYLLVDQKEPRIERYRRQAEREWMLTEVIGLEDDVELASIG
jgi:Uma2 family endonuclease